MALPESVRVKISSEAAAYVSLTPVVVEQMGLAGLIEHVLGSAGKDLPRVREILRRGSLVSGASRLRWDPLDAAEADLEQALAQFPDPEPGRPFAADRCTRIVLAGPTGRLEIERQVAEERKLLRRRSFWDELPGLAVSQVPAYAAYSYRQRSDIYRLPLDAAARAALREAGDLLKYEPLRKAVLAGHFETVEFCVPR